jgi:ubiquinone/menaquinone biosynthesis C-methylase UbiE
VLDAVSTLNHEHILDRFLTDVESFTIETFKPEAAAFADRRISYVYDDIRDLPFRDDRFDAVVSLSTLEHVGMDNVSYGSQGVVAEDPDVELALTVAELLRVLKPNGDCFITLPFGAFEDHRWFRQFGERGLDILLELLQ